MYLDEFPNDNKLSDTELLEQVKYHCNKFLESKNYENIDSLEGYKAALDDILAIIEQRPPRMALIMLIALLGIEY